MCEQRKLKVSYESQTNLVSIGDGCIRPFLSRAMRHIPTRTPRLGLAFETRTGDLAGVTTDFALKLVANTDEEAGRLILTSVHDIPSVDVCMQTVLTAVVDTAARGDVAAVFLALSGAWTRAVREFGGAERLNGEEEAGVDYLHACVKRALREDVSEECSLMLADAAVGRIEGKEQRCVKWFYTHAVGCSVCLCEAIQGVRYSCNSLNLCERCRRSVGDSGGELRSFTVYEHPWEATEDYEGMDGAGAGDCFKVPPAPLRVGDRGPKVWHLHYVLYKVGYLNVSAAGFRVGVFCGGTRERMLQFQEAHVVDGGGTVSDLELGVYSTGTRRRLICVLDELEATCAAVCCVAVSATQSSNTRLSMAMAA